MTTPQIGLNYISKNRAKMVIPDLPAVSFNMREFELPGIDLPAATVPSPFYDKPFYGDKVEFEPLDCTFLVDENLTNWIEVYNWIIGLGAPEDKSQYENRSLTEIDIYITIYSSHNNPIKRVRFIECVPTSLSGIFFEEGINETTTVESTVRIAYRRYEFVDLE